MRFTLYLLLILSFHIKASPLFAAAAEEIENPVVAASIELQKHPVSIRDPHDLLKDAPFKDYIPFVSSSLTDAPPKPSTVITAKNMTVFVTNGGQLVDSKGDFVLAKDGGPLYFYKEGTAKGLEQGSWIPINTGDLSIADYFKQETLSFVLALKERYDNTRAPHALLYQGIELMLIAAETGEEQERKEKESASETLQTHTKILSLDLFLPKHFYWKNFARYLTSIILPGIAKTCKNAPVLIPPQYRCFSQYHPLCGDAVSDLFSQGVEGFWKVDTLQCSREQLQKLCQNPRIAEIVSSLISFNFKKKRDHLARIVTFVAKELGWTKADPGSKPVSESHLVSESHPIYVVLNSGYVLQEAFAFALQHQYNTSISFILLLGATLSPPTDTPDQSFVKRAQRLVWSCHRKAHPILHGLLKRRPPLYIAPTPINSGEHPVDPALPNTVDEGSSLPPAPVTNPSTTVGSEELHGESILQGTSAGSSLPTPTQPPPPPAKRKASYRPTQVNRPPVSQEKTTQETPVDHPHHVPDAERL
jgi:hypothetical protein